MIEKNTNCIPYFILSIYTHVASVVDIILPAVKDIFIYVLYVERLYLLL